jgi:hypothetical protein
MDAETKRLWKLNCTKQKDVSEITRMVEERKIKGKFELEILLLNDCDLTELPEAVLTLKLME